MIKHKVLGIHFARALGCLLVVYDHVFVDIPVRMNIAGSDTIKKISASILHPFGIIQDCGFLGVALFFLCSGYIISLASQKENVWQYSLKRVLRIYPPFWVSLIPCLLLLYSVEPSRYSALTTTDIALGSTLLNYLKPIQNTISGVAWTLLIEVLFYGLWALAYYPLRSIRLAMLFQHFIIGLILFNARNLGDHFFLLSASVAYIPILNIGQYFYFARSKQLPLKHSLCGSLCCLVLFLYGLYSIHSAFLTPDNLYGPSITLALFIFTILLSCEESLTLSPLLNAIGNYSYSIYLLHGPLAIAAFSLLKTLAPNIPSLAFSIALVPMIYYSSMIFYHAVELPSQRIGRHLSLVAANKIPE